MLPDKVNIDFLHIGYHRCGSTSLQSGVFSNADGVRCVKSGSEFHKYGYITEDAKWFGQVDGGVGWFSNEGLCGVDYLSRTPTLKGVENCKKLYSAYPDAKVLIMVRSQPDLIKSYYGLALRKSDYSGSLDEYALNVFPREELLFENLIGEYVDHFGVGQVAVLPLKYLACDADGFYKTLGEFMGVDFSGRYGGRKNKSSSSSMLAYQGVNRFYRALGVDGEGINRSSAYLENVKKYMNRIIGWVPANSCGYSPEVSHELHNYYASSVNNVAGLLMAGSDAYKDSFDRSL